MMSPVMTLRVGPAPGAGWRALLSTVEIMVAVVAAHTIAGGALPSVPWLVGLVAILYGGSLGVVTGRASLPWMLAGVTGAQFGLHAALVALAPTAGDAAHAAHAGGGLTWQMALAHVAGALVTALVWRTRRRLIHRLFFWPVPRGGVAAPRRTAPVAVAGLPAAQAWLTSQPRRGPPAGLCCA